MLPEVKATALQKLKTAQGQLAGVLKMVEDERYCVDISKQLLAIQALIKKANNEVLRGHIKTCVVDAVQNGEGEEKISEIFELIEKYGKG